MFSLSPISKVNEEEGEVWCLFTDSILRVGFLVPSLCVLFYGYGLAACDPY